MEIAKMRHAKNWKFKKGRKIGSIPSWIHERSFKLVSGRELTIAHLI
jgi:hypothetical protein